MTRCSDTNVLCGVNISDTRTQVNKRCEHSLAEKFPTENVADTCMNAIKRDVNFKY